MRLFRLGVLTYDVLFRAKRWMKQRPLESKDSNQRVVEELLELSSIVLLGETSACANRISERWVKMSSSLTRLLPLKVQVLLPDIHGEVHDS